MLVKKLQRLIHCFISRLQFRFIHSWTTSSTVTTVYDFILPSTVYDIIEIRVSLTSVYPHPIYWAYSPDSVIEPRLLRTLHKCSTSSLGLNSLPTSIPTSPLYTRFLPTEKEFLRVTHRKEQYRLDFQDETCRGIHSSRTEEFLGGVRRNQPEFYDYTFVV